MYNQPLNCLPKTFIAEGNGLYRTPPTISATEIIEAAKALLNERFRRITYIANSQHAEDFFILQLAGFDFEVFAVAFLDTKHRVIAFEPMFKGTMTAVTVSPREVVKRALALNAACVILAHNHPSGVPNPSKEDISLTNLLKESLKMFAIEVLDHLVIGGTQVTSFAEEGLL